MAQQVTITSVTANTPVDIYYCDSLAANCVYVASVSTFPYTFVVPDPYDLADYVIKIIDINGCIDIESALVTPTPTTSVTPTITPTNTQTPTTTPTNTTTPTTTSTPTTTITTTPTQTPTPTATPVVSIHAIGQNTYTSSATTCGDVMSIQNLYCYINQANTVPVIGVTVYSNLFDRVLYTPYNGLNRWILMEWGGFLYAVQIDTLGTIVDYGLCTPIDCSVNGGNVIISPPSVTPTNTSTPTRTPSITSTPTQTLTNTSTTTQTPTNTPTNTTTTTRTPSPTTTTTPTQSTTRTPSITPSITPTNTPSQTPIDCSVNGGSATGI
jgi:hypothetical protein